jgi:hypothetical protein
MRAWGAGPAVLKPLATVAGFVRAVGASMTWRAFVVANLLGLCVQASRELKFFNNAPPNYMLSGLIITQLGSLCVLLAVLAGDEAVRRGSSAWFAYTAAVLTASIVTAFGQWYIRGWFHLYTVVNQPGVPIRVQYTMIIFVACDVLMFGGFAVLAYVNRRSAQRILEGVRSAELKRVQIERRLTESRLATAQAQIDPHTLTRSLTEVRDLYKLASPDADLELDALIQRLQATVTGSAGADLRGGATP